MSVALHAADPGAEALRARRSHERLLVYALAGSVLLHAVVVVLAPAFRKPASEPPRPLEVVLAAPVPPPVKVEPPPRPMPPPPLARAPVVQPPRELKRAPAPQPAAERKPVLALPETVATTRAYTVPQAPVESTPAPAAESRAVVVAPAAAPVVAAPAAKEAPATPPVFNAAYLGNAPPRYPLIARRNGVEGTVQLRVVVSREGRPTQVGIEKSSGSPPLDNAALDAVKGWRFAPARRGQETVEQPVVVPVVFRLEGTS